LGVPHHVTVLSPITLPGDRAVPGTLTFGGGKIETGVRTLTIGASGAVAGAVPGSTSRSKYQVR
jgi:hypothetical protein